jgi:hypothetical protein
MPGEKRMELTKGCFVIASLLAMAAKRAGSQVRRVIR